MKHRRPSLFRIAAALLMRSAVVLGLLSSVSSAQVPAQDDFITREEFEAVRKMFSFDKCDIPTFAAQSKVLGFKATWRFFDDSPDEPEGQLSDLDSDSLCLIAMSSSFQAYRLKPPEKNGRVYSVAIRPENVFPENLKVSELEFYLPKSLAPKSCTPFEGASVPYKISVKKKDGWLTRRFNMTDTDDECFIAVLKKKKLSQGQ